MIRCSTDQEDIKIINIYVPNIRVPKYMNQTLKEFEGKKKVLQKIIDLNTPLSIMDRTTNQKIKK